MTRLSRYPGARASITYATRGMVRASRDAMNRNASPKPNAPNTTAWISPLGAYAPPPSKPRKAVKANPWTKPIGQVSK